MTWVIVHIDWGMCGVCQSRAQTGQEGGMSGKREMCDQIVHVTCSFTSFSTVKNGMV